MGAITEDILEYLYDMVFRPYRIVYGYIPKEYSRNSIQKSIRRLETKGFIEKGLMEDEICIRLTKIGAEELEKRRQRKKELSKISVKPKEKWDGLWRVVMFDIPEQNKRIRRALRDMLRLLEFFPLQKSVWISKRNYTKELRKWIDDLRLSSYIKVLETKNIY